MKLYIVVLTIVVFALVIVAAFFYPIKGTAVASNLDSLGMVNSGTLLSLVVALSAYLATVRLFAIYPASDNLRRGQAQ